MVDVIQQTYKASSTFICIYQPIQVKYMNLKFNRMNHKMRINFAKMKEKASENFKKSMINSCGHTDPREDFTFVKYRTVRNRVQPQVLIEIDFNKFL